MEQTTHETPETKNKSEAEVSDPSDKVTPSGKGGGAAESGVLSCLLRKTSIRRRLSTEKREDGTEEVIYGRNTKEYYRLKMEIMADPAVKNALDALQERWKMIMFMYEDCIDMIQERKERDIQWRKCKERREIFATCIVYTCIMIPITLFVLITTLILVG